MSELVGTKLPSARLIMLDGATFHTIGDSIPGRSTIVFLFSTECPFCNLQADEIINGISDLSQVKIVLVSQSPLQDIKSFSDKHKLSSYRNIIVGYDYNGILTKYFKSEYVPFLAFYNKQNILNATHVGTLDVNEMLDLVK